MVVGGDDRLSVSTAGRVYAERHMYSERQA
jgi:hypothetical protein